MSVRYNKLFKLMIDKDVKKGLKIAPGLSIPLSENWGMQRMC